MISKIKKLLSVLIMFSVLGLVGLAAGKSLVALNATMKSRPQYLELECMKSCDMPVRGDGFSVKFKECVAGCMEKKGYIEYYLKGWIKVDGKVD